MWGILSDNAFDARQFVEDAGAGRTVLPHDIAAMTAALRELIAAGRAPDRQLGSQVQRFERRELARKLAAIVHRATD